MTDIEAYNQGSFLLIESASDLGDDWLSENLDGEPMAGPTDRLRYAVDHRYGPDILLGAHNEGLIVSLDGRIADAERN